MATTLSRRFFAKDADVVARALLGHRLVHDTPEGRAAVRIVETEAYFGPPRANAHLARRQDMPRALREELLARGDPASHAFPGPTARNRVMFGPPGHAYVYLIYGIHDCMNIVTGPEGEPQAVLLRAGLPVEGEALMRDRRPATKTTPSRGHDAHLAGGPARLAAALGITREHYGLDLTSAHSPLRVERARRIADVAVGPRINVVGGEKLPLRFRGA